MNYTNTSIFKLIELFTIKTNKTRRVSAQEHCEHQQLHDYYCDTERPFLNNKGIIDMP